MTNLGRGTEPHQWRGYRLMQPSTNEFYVIEVKLLGGLQCKFA